MNAEAIYGLVGALGAALIGAIAVIVGARITRGRSGGATKTPGSV